MAARGHSSAGRALPLHGRGRRFESGWLHIVRSSLRLGFETQVVRDEIRVAVGEPHARPLRCWAGLSAENVEIVRRAYDRWATGDFRAGAADLDPHVVFVVRPPFLEPGVYLGPDGVRDYMRRFLVQWEQYTIEAEHLEAVGDTVLARIHQHGRGKASGIDTELRSYMLFTFRGRKIVRIENVLDEAEALEAAGLAE